MAYAAYKVYKWLVLFAIANGVVAMIQESDLPKELYECMQLFLNTKYMSNTDLKTDEDVQSYCLQMYLWQTNVISRDRLNITDQDAEFINSLVRSLAIGRRPRRQIPPIGVTPATGFRVRREYRRLSDAERTAFHNTLQTMKTNGQYDIFANLHQGIISTSAHGGPNFLGWHRIYILLFEEALRRINRAVSLPYWDSTLDFDMDNPVNSIIWSSAFLGNGNGFVTQGPFANWQTSMGTLTRDIGSGSRLFSKEVIRDILTRCRNSQISETTAQARYNLELAHGGPHVWTGGHLSGVNTAGHDPVFFMLHAYVDYVWELFRIRQATTACNVNPETDYPVTTGLHSSRRRMDGFPQYRSIDGLLLNWTRTWYRYEQSPVCSTSQPSCGTPYLRCNVTRQRCVSVARNISRSPFGAAGFDHAAASPEAAITKLKAVIGPIFNAPPHEPRTQGAQLALTRSRRSGPPKNETKNHNSSLFNHHSSWHTFKAPSSDGRTSDVLGKNIASGVINSDPVAPAAIPGKRIFENVDPLPLLSIPHFVGSTGNNVRHNGFVFDDNSDISWIFIPVKVVYRRLYSSTNSSSPIFSKPHWRMPTCVHKNKDFEKIKVVSQGLNYYGKDTDYIVMDSNIPFDSAVTFVRVKSPDDGVKEVILSAIHSCGRICQPFCHVPGSNLTHTYRPCTGVLKVSSEDPNGYGRTFKEAVSLVWKGPESGIFEQDDQIKVLFYCSMEDAV